MRMHFVILSFVFCPCLQMFFILSHKRHDFRKTIFRIKYVFGYVQSFYLNISLILRRTVQDTIKNLYRSSRKVTVFLVRLYLNFNSLHTLSKKVQISQFIKIRTLGAEPSFSKRAEDSYGKANSRFS
jgi:hypothetical protein